MDLLKQILNYLRASRIIAINGIPGSESPNGTSFIIPVGGAARGGGGESASYIPWKPTFSTEGTTTTVYKCRFNLGTVNDVAASNWNDPHTLTMDVDDYQFVVLTITTGSGKVTSVSLAVATVAPVEDTIASGTPPVTFKIVLGAIGRTSAKMIVTRNIALAAAEVFRESKAAPATGQEPFTRWWRWATQYIS